MKLLRNPNFTKSAYNLLEVAVIMENCKMRSSSSKNIENISSEAPALVVLLKSLDRESRSLIATLKTDVKEESVQENKESDIVYCDGLQEIVNNMFSTNLTRTNNVPDFQSIFVEGLSEKELNVLETGDTRRNIKFDQVNVAWRTAANITLSCSRFQAELLNHPVAKTMEELFKLLSVLVATNKITGTFYNTLKNIFISNLLYIGRKFSQVYQCLYNSTFKKCIQVVCNDLQFQKKKKKTFNIFMRVSRSISNYRAYYFLPFSKKHFLI